MQEINSFKISVIIPTYNRGYVLKKVISSYFSDKVNEIIIVDDGSNDDTYKVVSKSILSFRNIKYVRHEKRKGLPAARNTGIKNVSNKSDYIFFGEDDVFLIENCYDIMLEVLNQNQVELVAANVKYLSEGSDFKKYLKNDISLVYPRSLNDIFKFKSIHMALKCVYNDFNFDEGYILNSYREETDFYIRVNQKYSMVLIENYLAFNLPRNVCNKGGEWSFNPFIYEISTIYNNMRFLVKNKKYTKMNFLKILVEQIKFSFERLRILKVKIWK